MPSIEEFDHLRVPLDAIKLATNNFNNATNYISRGGFGKVYKGELVLRGELVTVAIKRLDRTLGQGAHIIKQLEIALQYQCTPSSILEYHSLLGDGYNLKNARVTVRTQAAFEAHDSFRPRTKVALKYFDTDEKQHYVIAAIKIQRAYRCYRKRKQMAATALIHYVFR
ncbi:hypothetical protein L1987_00089 [Smallanthus sonchifolius]|uniref:Uncharacterized protein n=1 Tax=Smallanthus sonchifolius TaxID=185202 RepID=A0ACB9K1C6_9ASTR|nr:hypothetical protein L1987_00089 [Smallanthus sonchifolius]